MSVEAFTAPLRGRAGIPPHSAGGTGSTRSRAFAIAASWPVVLTTVLVVGTVLRVVAINTSGYNSDEAVYAGQAASVAGDQTLTPFFPVFRAHPMLFQTLLSLFYLNGVSDVGGRLLAACFGVGTIVVVYLTGTLLHGRRVGLLAAALLAVMPYHVVVSRQVLLDGPMTFFATVTLYLLARYSLTGRASWLYSAGGALGLTFLSKETGALLLGAVYAFFALSRDVHVRARDLLFSGLAFLAVAIPYPLSLVFSGKSSTGSNFLAWQVFRRPNHGPGFYFTAVPPALGLAVVALALIGLIAVRRSWTWRDTLLLAWIVVPVMVFEIWSVKGFQYLLPTAAPFAILAARALLDLPFRLRLPANRQRWVAAGLVTAALVSLAVPSWLKTRPSHSGTFLAGSGAVPGGREAGEWVEAHVPEGSNLLALGPSMANILQFYGHRRIYGLSVSSNPLHRNPTYVPVGNADLQIRSNKLQYVVWDSYSAGRSPYFAGQLMRYVERYHGRAVLTQTASVAAKDGGTVTKPVIVIYEVRP